MAERHPQVSADLEDIAARLGDTLRALSGRSLVITGATGLLATYLCETVAWANEHVLQAPCRLTGIVRREPSPQGPHGHLLGLPGIRFLVHDACRAADLDEADYLILAASKGAPRDYLAEPLATLAVNGAGLTEWLELALRLETRGVLYFSSGEIYGPAPTVVPTPEDYPGALDPTSPRSVYAEGKRYGEALALAYWRARSLPVTIARPFQVFGPGIRPDDGRALPDFICRAARGEAIVLRSAGLARRTFLYIADATVAFFKILLEGAPGSVFNVGQMRGEVSIRELAERISALAGGTPLRIEQDDSGQGSPLRSCPDTGRLREALDVEPEFDLDRLLTCTLRWARDRLTEASP